jgi:hypothetical protein
MLATHEEEQEKILKELQKKFVFIHTGFESIGDRSITFC